MSQEKEYKLICKLCGKTFMSTDIESKLCQKCTQYAHKEAHKAKVRRIIGEPLEKNENTFICKRCGKTFKCFGKDIWYCKDCRSALEKQFKMNNYFRRRKARRERNAKKLGSE